MADDLALIDPRPPPPRYITKPRTLPNRACKACGRSFVFRGRVTSRFCSRRCSDGSHDDAHSPEFIAWVRVLWDAGHSISQIAAMATLEYGWAISRNVIAGITHRNDFPPRAGPANIQAARKARESAHG